MVLIVALLMFSATQLYSQKDDWIKIAEKNVAFKNEKDKISLKGDEKKVDKIKVTCVQGTLQLKSITIAMANGNSKTYDAKGLGVMSKGMSSMNYAVPDKDEKIKYIEFEYDSKGSIITNKRAKVEIWGKQGDDD